MRFTQTELLKIAFETAGSSSPKAWFHEEDFRTASKHFDHPDWAEITLNGYRSRYLAGECVDPRYEPLHTKLSSVLLIEVPTIMMQGASDFCDLPSAFEGQEKYFAKGYERILLEGVGHFPHREAPAAVAGGWL